MSYVEFKQARKKTKHYLVEQPLTKTYAEEQWLKEQRERVYEKIYGAKSYITRKTESITRKRTIKGTVRGETLIKRGYKYIKLKGLPWSTIAHGQRYLREQIEALKDESGTIYKWKYLPIPVE